MPTYEVLPLLLLEELLCGRPPDGLFAVLRFEPQRRQQNARSFMNVGSVTYPTPLSFLPSFLYLFIYSLSHASSLLTIYVSLPFFPYITISCHFSLFCLIP